jgi:hypothetical protein
LDHAVAIRILKILPVGKENAMTAVQVLQKFSNRSESLQTASETSETKAELRKMQRYLQELSDTKVINGLTAIHEEALINRIEDAKSFRYYKQLSKITLWEMNDQVALNLLMTRQVVTQALGKIGDIQNLGMGDVARQVVDAKADLHRFRARVRLVPDGLGRCPADIRPEVLSAVIQAIKEDRQLKFTYVKTSGTSSAKKLSIQGLVAKDGTMYVIATKSFNDPPVHYALHRMTEASVDKQAALIQVTFNLDRYIEDSHQLSHVFADEPRVNLQLRVAPEAIFHFQERKLTSSQMIVEPSAKDDWYRLSAPMANTVLLVPFLLSMGVLIEVMGPPSIRAEVSNRLQKAANFYRG